MAHRQANKNINTSDDFLLISRHKDVIKIQSHNNDSPNIILDLAVANKPFLELLRAVLKTVDEHQENQKTDRATSDRSAQSAKPEQGEVQEAEIVD